jgi:pSer/pThr/pTyr-binding forkhead associated (FHA) protein
VHLRDYMLIGRGDACDLVLDSKRTPMMISRCHVVLNHEDDVFTLTDQGSLNGVLINGQKMQGKQALTDGDVVTFGVATIPPELDYIFETPPQAEIEDDGQCTVPA